ncbi:mucin-19-like [Struthio camelus]|uniref:mucin-19-like n=1 Tax=Struthio camelus TaxID=8801 RepID=UPI003603E17E
MGSPKQSRGAGPPNPADAASLWPKMALWSEREGDACTTLCPAANVAEATSGWRCKALLVLAICLSATVLPYSVGSLAALSQAFPASQPLSHAQPGLKPSQSRVSDDLVAAYQDPHTSPAMQQSERALVAPGTFPGVEGDLYHSADAERLSLGALTQDTAVPSTPQTLLVPQPGSLAGEAQGSGAAAIAVMLSQAPTVSAQLLRAAAGATPTAGFSPPGSALRHDVALESLPGEGAGLHEATRLPAVAMASARGCGQVATELGPAAEPMRAGPGSSPLLSSKGGPSLPPTGMAQLISKMRSQGRRSWGTLRTVRMPDQKPALVESSTAAMDRQPWVPAASSPAPLSPMTLALLRAPCLAATPSGASAGTEEKPAVDAGTELLDVVPTRLALPEEVAAREAHVPSDAPSGVGSAEMLAGTPSLSHTTTDQSRLGLLLSLKPAGQSAWPAASLLDPEISAGPDVTRALFKLASAGASSDCGTTLCRADHSLVVSSKPPARVTAHNVPSQARAVTVVQAPRSMPLLDRSTASSFSDVQHEAVVAEATTGSLLMSHWSHNRQKEVVTPSPGQHSSSHSTSLPDLGMGKDPTAASRLVPLPGVLPTLLSERTSSLAEIHPGTMGAPSAAKPKRAWGTHPADSFLHGEAALLADTVLAKVLKNGSSLLAAVSASPPSAASATHDVKHQQTLAPFPAAEEFRGPAVTSEKQGNLSSHSVKQTLSTSSGSPPSSALTRDTRTAGDTVAGVSLAALDTVSEPRVSKTSCKGGAAAVASSLEAAGVTDGAPLSQPTWRPSLHPKLFPMSSFAIAYEDGPTAGTPGQYQAARVATEVAERSVLPAEAAVAEGATSGKPRVTSDAAVPSGPPEPTCAIQSSASSPTLKDPTPGHQPEASTAFQTGKTAFSSLSYVSTSTRAVYGPGSLLTSQTMTVPTGFMPVTHSVSSRLVVTSQPPFIAGEDLSAATRPTPAGKGFTAAAPPTESMAASKLGSPEAKLPVSQAPGLLSPAHVHVLPLQFRLTGIAYSEALSSKSSESYKKLEKEVRLMLNGMLSTYENFLQANILEFMNGSVIVQGEALFRGDSPAPTSSHLIRTIVTEVSRGRDPFSWQLEVQSIQSSGFSLENLDPEKLSISLIALRLGSVASGGMGRTDPLDRLISEVIQSLSVLYHVKNFTIAQLRNLRGDLEISGEVYLNTVVHADVAKVLQALKVLSTCSVDLISLSVEGARLHLKVYPVSFLVTNRHFSEDLLDPFSVEYQELTRELGDVVGRALRDHRSFLQVVIRGFLPGSLICHGDVIFQHPAPTSLEVLEALAVSVGPDKAWAGSGFQVDPFSLAVGEDTLEPPPADSGFPEYGVVIIVMCGLGIITIPIVLLVCLRTKRLAWQDVAALWDRRDPEAGTQTLEMDNQGFWAASEEASSL